jgi:hypothetical protein
LGILTSQAAGPNMGILPEGNPAALDCNSC